MGGNLHQHDPDVVLHHVRKRSVKLGRIRRRHIDKRIRSRSLYRNTSRLTSNRADQSTSVAAALKDAAQHMRNTGLAVGSRNTDHTQVSSGKSIPCVVEICGGTARIVRFQ